MDDLVRTGNPLMKTANRVLTDWFDCCPVTSTRCLFDNVLPAQATFFGIVGVDRKAVTVEPEPWLLVGCYAVPRTPDLAGMEMALVPPYLGGENDALEALRALRAMRSHLKNGTRRTSGY